MHERPAMIERHAVEFTAEARRPRRRRVEAPMRASSARLCVSASLWFVFLEFTFLRVTFRQADLGVKIDLIIPV
jgi:hypothetical protein